MRMIKKYIYLFCFFFKGSTTGFNYDAYGSSMGSTPSDTGYSRTGIDQLFSNLLISMTFNGFNNSLFIFEIQVHLQVHQHRPPDLK